MTNTPKISWTSAMPPEAVDYPVFAPATIVDGDIVLERDVEVTLRDGVKIYTDVYRPAGSVAVPAIVAWSPYGKKGGFWKYEIFPNNAGVPLDAVSDMAKFEGPDPAFWCRHGYAVVNPDPRGSWNSNGDLCIFGPNEPMDAFDVIEWVAGQPWCTGKVGMSGCSWLGASQWLTAAQRPPHLAAINPWEGFSDIYREIATRGGIPENKFLPELMTHLYGRGRREDLVAMQASHPLIDEYWVSKSARLEDIEIPTFVVASWTNPLHVRGTFEGFRRIASLAKWLRVHASFEWPDYHGLDQMAELKRFFDRYLKDTENDWEATPPVRLKLLDGTRENASLEMRTWPPENTKFHRLYLDAKSGGMTTPVPMSSRVHYDVESERPATSFEYRFERDFRFVGYSKLRLWVEAEGADDMDLFILVEKLDADGKAVPFPIPILHVRGAMGWLRVSHRELDTETSTPQQPRLLHQHEQLLSPKEIVPVEIEIWPWGGVWHAGEVLRLTIGARTHSDFVFDGPGRNEGVHIIHTGGQYDSHLLIPELSPV